MPANRRAKELMQGGIGDIVLWAAIIPAQREETDGALICGPTPIYNLSQLQCFSKKGIYTFFPSPMAESHRRAETLLYLSLNLSASSTVPGTQ